MSLSRTRAEALKNGDMFYYTAKLCINNHRAKRLTVNGNCIKCAKEHSIKHYENVVIPFKNKLRKQGKMKDVKTANELIEKDSAQDIFCYWVDVMQKDKSRTKLDKGRLIIINKALKSYSPDDLRAAIRGCSMSEWHMGENPGYKIYNSLDLIFRNADKTEWFIDVAKNPKPRRKVKTERERRLEELLNR